MPEEPTTAERAADLAGFQRAAKQYASARVRYAETRDELRQQVRAMAHVHGTAETELSRLAGVDRMTIRAWLGK